MKAAAQITPLRRELAVVCDGEGMIREADDAAYLLAGLTPGKSLLSFAVAGTEDKLIELLRRAGQNPVDGWEACLTVRGLPATLNFRAAPATDGAGIVLVADLVP